MRATDEFEEAQCSFSIVDYHQLTLFFLYFTNLITYSVATFSILQSDNLFSCKLLVLGEILSYETDYVRILKVWNEPDRIHSPMVVNIKLRLILFSNLTSYSVTNSVLLGQCFLKYHRREVGNQETNAYQWKICLFIKINLNFTRINEVNKYMNDNMLWWVGCNTKNLPTNYTCPQN